MSDLSLSGRDFSRRSLLKAGTGLTLGTGLGLGAGIAAAAPAAATNGVGQTGTPLCQNPGGDSASQQGLGCGDLGIPYYRQHDNSWGYVFGDSYAGPTEGDRYIGSPVMLNQATFDSSGATPISFTWAMPTYGQARQTFNYQHNANNGLGDFEITRIPNDCIEFGGRTYIQYTSVFTWGPLPAGWDGSVCSGIAYSDDYGVTWNDFGYHWPGDRTGGNESLYGMWSFAGIDADGFLYIYSKRWNGGHQNTADQGLIQLFRFTQDDFHNGAWGNQQNWAQVDGVWQWTRNALPTPLFPAQNNFGEFSVKNINGTYCMSYFDVDNYAIYTRTSPRPEGGWSVPLPQIVGDYRFPTYWGKPQVPNLYGGYIHPGSASATSLTLIVSQWPGNNAPSPYRVLQFDGINP